MVIESIPFVLAAMILWDLSLHVLKLFGFERKFLESTSVLSYYYPHFRWKKTPNGPLERLEQEWRPIYDMFWTCYWGVAFVLLLAYLYLR